MGVPADPHQVLTRNVDEDGNPGPIIDVPYRQLIGSLLYLAIGTRADISFAVSALSQFWRILQSFTGKQQNVF